jgi:hypothetical protein
MALNARAKKKTNDYSLFDVVYDDGSRTSNRKVPDNELVGDDKDEAAKAYLETQDRKIAEASGKYRGTITAVLPVSK